MNKIYYLFSAQGGFSPPPCAVRSASPRKEDKVGSIVGQHEDSKAEDQEEVGLGEDRVYFVLEWEYES